MKQLDDQQLRQVTGGIDPPSDSWIGKVWKTFQLKPPGATSSQSPR